ncbi:glycoside hydrolase family 18 protein [Colletotrichum sp. SAR 10_75]|nr:glycoside hydrolase family 18 protein [Colletotrichum sp. SAR 10_75]
MLRLTESGQSISYINLDEGFSNYIYGLLYRLMNKPGFDDVDAKITALILHLRKEFGRNFLLTLAHDRTELLG